MTIPTTETGRALADAIHGLGGPGDKALLHPRAAIVAIEAEAFAAGLIEAKRRLSVAGMHDGKCPEPASPCRCGLESAIDGYATGGPMGPLPPGLIVGESGPEEPPVSEGIVRGETHTGRDGDTEVDTIAWPDGSFTVSEVRRSTPHEVEPQP